MQYYCFEKNAYISNKYNLNLQKKTTENPFFSEILLKTSKSNHKSKILEGLILRILSLEKTTIIWLPNKEKHFLEKYIYKNS